MTNSRQRLYSLTDAAREIGTSTSNLRNYANEGRVHCIRLSNGTRVFPAESVVAEKLRRQAKRSK